MEKLNIAILGTPVSSGNRGVLALGTSLINLCAARAGQVTLLLGHKDHVSVSFRVNGNSLLVPIVNCRLSPKSRPREHLAWIILASILYRVFPLGLVQRMLSRATPWIKAIEKADLVGDVRGGDSFSDIYGIKRFLLGFLMVWTVVLVKGTIIQFPQTYGPYQSPVARWLARYLLRRSSTIIARDRQSQRVAQELIGPGKRVRLSPDVAFSLEAIDPKRIQFDPPISRAGISGQFSRPIGLNINGLMYNGGYTRNNMFGLKLNYIGFLSALINKLLMVHAGELWLIPHTYSPPKDVESDPEACLRVRATLSAEMQERVRIVTGEYDCHEIKGIIGQCDFFVGSRMHACIAALSQGVPCVGVAYSRKFAGVFESVGMADWVVDGRDASNEQAVARVLELYRRRDEVRVSLRQAADKAREQLNEIFSQLLSPGMSKIARN